VRGLTLCHLDAVLKGQYEAGLFWNRDIKAQLDRRGIDAIVTTKPL
jgi:hypothetical protein